MRIRYTSILWAYVVVALCLFFYSYTQIDLNLTLSRASLLATIQKSFQSVGYYHRPISTVFYICIISVLFGLYSVVIASVKKDLLSLRQVWELIGVVTILLIFSYPAAFSYDFFNYLFTAKTVLVYHKNPYLVTPLQFAGIDPWTNFMRWTHLPSAYPPLWIGLSFLPFVLGLGYFLPVLFSMKLLIGGFFILTCVGIVRVMKREDPKSAALSLVVFALNPLVLIETLVSGHNDIVLVAFAVIAISHLVAKNYLNAWWVLALSIASKVVTIFLIPIFLLKKSRNWMLIAMITGLCIVVLKRPILPWYMVWIWPFIAITPRHSDIRILAGFFSFGLLLTYATYLYTGAFDSWVVSVNSWIPYAGLGLGFIFLFFYKKQIQLPNHKN